MSSTTIARIVPGSGFEPNTTIKSSEVDQELDQLVSAHNSLVGFKLEIDGSQAMTGALPMGGKKVVNMAAATVAADAVEYTQWQSSITTTLAAAMLLDGSQSMAADMNLGVNKVINMAAAAVAGDAVEYAQWLAKNQSQDAEISANRTGYSRRTAVIAIAVSTSAPPTEVLGDRYILDNSGTPNASWDGGLQTNIMEFNGTTWDATVPIEGYIAYVDSANQDALFVDDGTPQWELRDVIPTSHTQLSEIGTNTHAQIDTHVDGDGSDHADVATNTTAIANILSGATTFTQLNADNLRLDGNTMSSTNANGDINLAPNGTGIVRAGTDFTGTSFGQGIHIKTGSSGATIVNTSADDLVIEGSSNTGLTLLTPDSASGYIGFADTAATLAAHIAYSHPAGQLQFAFNGANRLLLSESAATLSSPLAILDDTAAVDMLVTSNGLASYSANLHRFDVGRAATSAYNFLLCNSSAVSTPDVEFKLRGDGNGTCDGAWTGGGADYAEYFESTDGEAIPSGTTVVLDGENVRASADGEDPDGVISANPTSVGNGADLKWSGRYLRTPYGNYDLDENGDRKLNPAFDPDVEYTSRSERDEWNLVGLLGQIVINKGQPTSSRWKKMKDVDSTHEMWLVR